MKILIFSILLISLTIPVFGGNLMENMFDNFEQQEQTRLLRRSVQLQEMERMERQQQRLPSHRKTPASNELNRWQGMSGVSW